MIQTDITSTAKSWACSSGHHWYVLTFTAKDHTRHLAAPTEWDWTHLKHTLRYIKGTLHYKFLISPRLPQGHSVPLRQLIPLHINTYCDSESVTGPQTSSQENLPQAQSHQYLEYLLHSTAEHSQLSQHRQQRRNSTPSASASPTAYTSTSYFKNFNNIFNDKPSTSATRDSVQPQQSIHNITIIDNNKITDSTSALSLSNKLVLNTRSKHIALRCLFLQDIQATGLVNIHRVTSHNNPANIYSSASHREFCSDIFVTTASLNCTSKRGRSTTSTSWNSLSSTSMSRRTKIYRVHKRTMTADEGQQRVYQRTSASSTTKVQQAAGTTLQQREEEGQQEVVYREQAS